MFSDVGHTKQGLYSKGHVQCAYNRHWASIMNASPTIKEFVYREVPTSTLAFVGD